MILKLFILMPIEIVVNDQVEVIDQLMFLLVLKKQLVNRPMTMATIAHAMGICPSRDEIHSQLQQQKPSIYVEDFRAFKPEWLLLFYGTCPCCYFRVM